MVRVFVGQDGDDGPTWVPADSVETGLTRGSVLGVGDINEDGAPDLVFTTEDNNRGRFFVNQDVCTAGLVERGDGNGDERVDLSDAVAILRHLFLGSALVCPAASEVNGDGDVDVSDALFVLNFLFQGGPVPVGESPTSCE